MCPMCLVLKEDSRTSDALECSWKWLWASTWCWEPGSSIRVARTANYHSGFFWDRFSLELVILPFQSPEYWASRWLLGLTFFFLMCMNLWPTCVSTYHLHSWFSQASRECPIPWICSHEHLMSCRVAAGIWNHILWKNSQCSLALNHLFSPHSCFTCRTIVGLFICDKVWFCSLPLLVILLP